MDLSLPADRLRTLDPALRALVLPFPKEVALDRRGGAGQVGAETRKQLTDSVATRDQDPQCPQAAGPARNPTVVPAPASTAEPAKVFAEAGPDVQRLRAALGQIRGLLAD